MASNREEALRNIYDRLKKLERKDERARTHDVHSLNNNRASAPPSATDDISQGYQVGSMWIVPGTPGQVWVCTDSTSGAAYWVLIS